jgi:hypothetical protein
MTGGLNGVAFHYMLSASDSIHAAVARATLQSQRRRTCNAASLPVYALRGRPPQMASMASDPPFQRLYGNLRCASSTATGCHMLAVAELVPETTAVV